jgi:extradiol dioxygenase family protein
MPVMPFHLAFPVTSLDKARAFYGGLLGCPEGWSSPEWVDFDFHGHQIVAHLSPDASHRDTSLVDGDNVPVRHFGLVASLG